MTSRQERPALASDTVATLALLVAAFVIRMPHFGDPAYMIDEQFYLLVGDRILHGAMPYVDIWDRKPVGLFLIYAAIRAIGGPGFLPYHIAAACFAGATAATIRMIAREAASGRGALLAGLAYLIWIEIVEGGGGQAPVFYNLPVALAGLATLRAVTEEEPRRALLLSIAAMAAIGLALQIKYTVVAEGAWFGLMLLNAARRQGGAWPVLIRRAGMLGAAAVAPTVLAFAVYAALGHAREYWFANFVSVFLRAPAPDAALHYRGAMMAVFLLPFAVCIAAGLLQLRREKHPAVRIWMALMLGWCVAALIGLNLVGKLYAHYLLPVFVPFAAAAAPILGRRTLGPAFALFLVAIPLPAIGFPDFATTRRHEREIATLTRLIPADAATRCLQIFDGPPVLYLTTHACLASRFAFPEHLSAYDETRAIGVDPAAELRRIFARRPAAVLISDVRADPADPATRQQMRATLARDYRLAGRAPENGRLVEVWTPR